MENIQKIRVAGMPVRFRIWAAGSVPAGVNAAGYDQVKDGFANPAGETLGVVETARGMTFSSPAVVQAKDFGDLDAEDFAEAQKVAERVARERMRVANPVGEYREPTPEEMVEAVKGARQANLEAWAWGICHRAALDGREPSARALEILGVG